MSTGYAGTQEKTEGPREATLNERLNKVSDSLQFQCERIQSVLARVNGTPPAVLGQGQNKNTLAQITPTQPLTAIVEMLESTNKRLDELAHGIERIA